MTALESIEQSYWCARSFSRFRGGMLENVKGTPMGKGHNNDDQPFDIETACYLKPIARAYDEAIQNGRRLKLLTKGGVKTLKSYMCEIAALDHINNRSGDVALYFGTEKSGDTAATTRIWDHFNLNTRFANKLATLTSRFEKTIGGVKFPDKSLLILPANLSNTQQLNLAFVGLQDAFLTGKSGMIKQMLERQTQYSENAITFLESQGGEKGYDFDDEYDKTDQGELHVLCPSCKQKHVFNWKAFDLAHMTRPVDFKVPALGGSVGGFHWRYCDERKNRTTAQLEEDFNASHEREVIKNTHFECFHCGAIWHDVPATREQLDRSSFYVSSVPDALTYERGFNFPQWINRRLSWSEIMLKKLRAIQKAQEFGNFEDLKQWWQKQAARTWDPDIPARARMLAVSIGSYETDPSKHRYGSDFHCRQLTVDCGKRIGASKNEHVIGRLFYEIREISKIGSSCQLARGMVPSWELLRAQQLYWGIPSSRVGIDAGWMPSQVAENCVKYFDLLPPGARMPIPMPWRLLYGADTRRMELNNKGVSFLRQLLPGIRTAHDKDGKLWRMSLLKITWSNLHFEQLLSSILSDTVSVKWEILDKSKVMIVGLDGKPSEELTRTYLDEYECETDSFHASWESQLNSRYLSEKTGKFEDYSKAQRPTEARDLAAMHLVLCAVDNLLGHTAD